MQNSVSGNAPRLDPETIAKLNEAERAGMSRTTVKQTEDYVGRFKEYLRKIKLSEQIEESNEETLAEYLRLFYNEVRGKKQADTWLRLR